MSRSVNQLTVSTLQQASQEANKLLEMTHFSGNN